MAKYRTTINCKRKSDARNKRRDSLTSNELVFHPWFLPQRVVHAIRSLIPMNYSKRMRNFFDDYGCMKCGTDQRYLANGMCESCYTNILKKLRRSAVRRLKSKTERHHDIGLIRQAKVAKNLLRRFSPDHRAESERLRMDTAESKNPVDEAQGN
jgi:hypothetical protein